VKATRRSTIVRDLATAASVVALVASRIVLVAEQPVPGARVFTSEQATTGRVAYANYCASCHMPDLTGNVEIPPLAGPTFAATWGARTTKDLFDYMSAAMPYGAPSLSMESYESIASYILQFNGAVAGTDSLTPLTVVSISSVIASLKSQSP
jgi:mono/diheme cytochrome c family protein